MKPKVYLICGVSGSGKTWVCKQLTDKFTYVPHDEHYDNQASVVASKASLEKAIITECPFAERALRSEMMYKYNLDVIPMFVITDPDIVASQYLKREGKPVAKNVYTRASTIINRALEWKAFYGSSEQVLNKLREL